MVVLDDWLLTTQRMAVHLPTQTGVVADLHLGYDHARQRGGEAVPRRPLAELLAPLATALGRHGASKLVIAGDLFEVGRGRWVEELVEELRTWLEERRVELVAVVPGNHDRGLGAGSGLPLCPEGVQLGDWQVVHGDGERPRGKVVQGHEHPWARWSARVGGPCYLARESHLVLPAYSVDAAGVNVLGNRRWAGHRCCVIAGEAVLDFGKAGALSRSARE